MKLFVYASFLVLATLTQAASLQGLQALGEDNWPTDAASVGRGMSGSTQYGEGFSVLNPARMAFDSKTRFYATLDYQGVYATSGAESIGRDRFDLTSIGLSIPMGGWGALGFGFWQRNSQTLNFQSEKGMYPDASIRYAGNIFELVPAYSVRLPGPARFISFGLAWHFPMGHFTNTLMTSTDSAGLDSESENLLAGTVIEEKVYGDWGCKKSDFLPMGGYASFSLQVHRKNWDYFATAFMTHDLTRTIGKSHQYTYTLYDTTATSNWEQTLHIPMQFGTGITMEPWAHQQVSFEFHQRSFGNQVDSALGWAGLPSNFRWTSNQRLYAIGWERSGSGVFFDPFIRRTAFRAGAWVRSWYLDGVEEAAGTVGVGMPLGKRGAKLDLGLYTGMRRFDEPSDASEVFWGIKAGFSGIGAWGQSSRRR